MKRTLSEAIVACVVLMAAALPRAVEPRQAPPPTISFELATRHIILKVTVNQSRPLSFVLDTGAAAAVIRTDTAKTLGLSLYGTVNAAGAGAGTQAGSRVKDATWSLVGVDGFSQPVALALPFPELPSAMGRDVDGIVGGEFIKQFVVELDYQARTMTLHNRTTFAYTGKGETLPIDFTRDGHPVLKATVTPLGGTPLERLFLFDTGAGLALALHSPFVIEQRLLGRQSKTIRAIGAAGAGGRTTGRLGRVESLKIGSFIINNPIALFSEDKAGAFANPALAGNIGAQLANRFRIFLDYGRRRIILEPTARLADPFDRAFSGLSLRAEGADYRTFRVREVLEQSPATEAGIVEGDIITAIDGTEARDLTLSAVNELFEKAGTYELTIKRGAQVIKTRLTTQRLI